MLDISLKKYSRKSKKNSHTYPFYSNTYNISVVNIVRMVKALKSQLTISNNAPSAVLKKLYLPEHRPAYFVIKSKWNDNLELTSLTDYFTEPCRILCAFKKQLSPLEYWTKNEKFILASLKKKNKRISPVNIREEMYINNKPCNNFRIPVCLEVLKLFKPKKWLDISAGWGDRLLSALLYNLTNNNALELYCGIDPNPCLHEYYNKMIKTFDNKNENKYVLIKDGFETAKLPDTKFDLVFSSPPFFDLEIYSNSKQNSLTKYKGVDAWFNGFLMPSLYKAYEYLETNGYIVLYMGEASNTQYIPKMIKLMNENMKNIIYLGIFYYTDNGKKYREFYCWSKSSISD